MHIVFFRSFLQCGSISIKNLFPHHILTHFWYRHKHIHTVRYHIALTCWFLLQLYLTNIIVRNCTYFLWPELHIKEILLLSNCTFILFLILYLDTYLRPLIVLEFSISPFFWHKMRKCDTGFLNCDACFWKCDTGFLKCVTGTAYFS